ncbi:MAG: hypothetical protein HYW70_03645 [Candidatus Nealsonbacteria bacterium]|nr:hypothetical protein [Candidatus Nealsonbacteria bacterium]
MPYVPSKKTDGKSTDREVLDKAVEVLAEEAAGGISDNLSLIEVYKSIFLDVAHSLADRLSGSKEIKDSSESNLALAIYEVGEKYGYQGAYLGEFNYAFTRFIQRVPQVKVENGEWTQEFRYWLYAATVEALTYASQEVRGLGLGVSGVFEDIKDEYKRRVNTAYETEQILKSGDCYDAPYYTRLVEVVDENGTHVGHQEIMLKREDATLKKDILDGKIVLKKKKKK